MKYIRTKDGIYEIDETTILASLPPCYKVIKPTDKHYAISEKKVIKQADTIEELCDEFVVVDKTWEEPLHIVLDTKDDMEMYLPNEIYGAIWTDKGLIYVAKMNESWCLELL